MNIPAHVLSGWCFGDVFGQTRRERLLIMVAAMVPDFDGIGILISEAYYIKFHHVYGHNVFFGLLLSALLAMFSGARRVRNFAIYLLIFHLHLLLDLVGSGPGWGMYYLWPLNMYYLESPYVWEFQSWQNVGAMYILLLWTLYIFIERKRTPLEILSSRLDTKLVEGVDKTLSRWRSTAEKKREQE